MATLKLSQEKLREQVGTLADRLVERGIAQSDSGFAKIAAMLPKAAEEMQNAEKRLGATDPKGALSPEQKALQQLQRAEAVFREVTVSQGGGGGGGGGGGQQQSNAEDLADLFELERDRMRNQYETVEQGQAEAADRTVDETLEKLKQLASRQQQENERMRRKADSLRSQMPSGGSGGGGGQRQLAQEAEEMARQLEGLARERSSPELGESARRLQEAADAMKRAAANGNQERGTAEANKALERLQEARRLLDNNRTSRLDRDVKDAAERARQLAEQQRQVMSDLDRLRQGQGNRELEQQLLERKENMANDVKALRDRLDRMASDSRSEQRDASRKLAEAADSIRDNKLEERIRYSKSLVRGGEQEYAASTENQIARDLDGLRDRLNQASGAVSEPTERRAERSLEEARNLVRGLESLDEGMRQRAEQSAQERRL